jgi:hypothetical protein
MLDLANSVSLANTLCYKWGYGSDIELFKKEASDRFSLLKDGTLKKPRCARLLLVNVSLIQVSILRTELITELRVLRTKSSQLMTITLHCNTVHLKRLGML